jgi:RNA-directed DNA polymerase
MKPESRGTIARRVALCLLAGAWEAEPLRARIERVRGATGFALTPDPLAARLLASFPGERAPSPSRLTAALVDDPAFLRAWERRPGAGLGAALAALPATLGTSGMEPPRIPCPPDLPALPTCGDLAAWLGVSAGALDWLADVQNRRRAADAEPLRHYRYSWRPRPGRTPRLIEIPKPRLKRIQRRIHDAILARVEPHPAALGFRSGCSVLDYAAPHAGKAAVARFDLEDFFRAIDAGRVYGVFRGLGYPHPVARSLAGLCTHGVRWGDLPPADLPPGAAMPDFRARQRIMTPHLPQGAPSSPALANLCTWRLDQRLSGLATRLGFRYTRYADDMAFSGTEALARGFPRLHVLVARICLEEGFALNTRKTRLTRGGRRQTLAGVVVNRHPNLPRDEFDRLKAVLWNCIRYGPAGQNRDGHPDFRAHLTGRVAWACGISARRGEKLRLLLGRIDWSG